MSRSFKTEGVAAGNADARKAAHQRRNARRAKHDNFFESHDSTLESTPHARTVPTHPVDVRPAYPRRWTPPGRT